MRGSYFWLIRRRRVGSYDRRVRELIRSVWAEPRPGNHPPVGWRDRLLVGLVVVLALLEASVRTDVPGRWVGAAIAIAVAPLLLWRRSRPLLVVLVAFGVAHVSTYALPGESADLFVLIYVVMLPYSLLRWGSGREVVLGQSVVLAAPWAALASDGATLGDAVGGTILLLVPASLGAVQRYRTAVHERELDRVRLLEREQLARDLHDTVAHHFSAIAVRAQAGVAVAATTPGAAVDALRVVEVEASRALAEMRSMVRLLRRDRGTGDGVAADLAPTPGVGDIVRLADRSDAGAGPLVRVRIDGDVDGLAGPVGTALYRMAQESVTNARRHARHATRVDVHVVGEERAVRLTVTDDGEPAPAGAPGLGLTGMTERAALLGGTCAAGPAAAGGWTVSATLPRTGEPG